MPGVGGISIGLGGGGGAGLPIPMNVSGLVAWYDPDSAFVTKDGSDNVSGWADRSGAGVSARNLSQAVGAKQPTWAATSGPNSTPVIHSTGGSKLLASGSNPFTGLSAAHTFIIWKVTNTSNNLVLRLGANAGTDHYPFSGTIYCGTFSANRPACGTPVTSLADYHLFEVVSTASEFTVKMNNASQYTTATNTVGLPSVAYLFSTDATNPGNVAHIAGLLVYSGKLSASDNTTIQSWVTSKFGIAMT